MKKVVMLSFFCLLIGAQIVKASDVKVKLNSADGSTSFQVRDSADVVVSSITSDGNAVFATITTTHTITAGSDIRVKGNDIFFGDSQTDRKIYDDAANYATRFSSNVYIEQGALRDRTVESGDLIVISSCTFLTDTVSVDSAFDTFVSIPGMYAELNVTAQPSMIFVNFCAPVKNSNAAEWARCRLKAYVVTPSESYVEVGFSDGVCPVGNANNLLPMNVCGAYRATVTGTYKVLIQWTDGGFGGEATTAGGRSFYTYWLGCN
ncbi:MAG: hypothetical protein CVU78_00355 [Elusimicrobia bacterium HGW-Elusimicrobia-2]|nr:MAG: hypothetical protein CVU78_00355 [Elusimicrobia bacterium HGW-Elusimicrobia-2]